MQLRTDKSGYRSVPFSLQKEVVDIDRIEAKYENGLLLHLMIPKKEEAKQKPPILIRLL